MKFYLALFLCLSALLISARAQSDADGRYVIIYGLIQQGDTLLSSGQTGDALKTYQEAQKQLQGFQKFFPDWDTDVVSYRLNDLAEKISNLQAQMPSQNAVVSAGPAAAVGQTTKPDQQLALLQQQLQAAQNDNARLQAKLKEALGTQPTMVDASELAKAQEQIRVLMKESDLFKASLKTSPATTAVPVNPPVDHTAKADAQILVLKHQLQTAQDENKQLQARLKNTLSDQSAMVAASQLTAAQAQIRSLTKENDLLKAGSHAVKNSSADSGLAAAKLASLNQEMDGLRSRLEADEAKPVPYSDEELALLKSSPVKIAAVQPAAEHPLSAEVQGLMASADQHFSRGEYDAAEADYSKILKLDQNNSLALGNLATIEMQEGKLAAAETHIKAALVQNPNDAYNLAVLGKIKFSQSKFDEAIDALSRSAKIEPKNPETQNYLGLAFSNKGLRPQAENALRRAIELDANYAPAHNNLAAFYLTQTPPSPQLALWHYQKAIAAGQPRNPDLEKMLADKGAAYVAK